MSFALSKAAPLKAEIRLAQAVSQFEADLSPDQKANFRSERSKTCKTPPDAHDVMYLTARIDRETSKKSTGGGRCFGPRFTNVLQAIQQFAALGDVIIGGSQNIIACGVWTLVRITLLSLVNFSSYMEKLSSLLMVAGRSAPRYQKMALLYTHSRILQSSLFEYFIVVVQLCHHMLRITKRTFIGQLVSSLSNSELQEYENGLVRWANAIKGETELLLNEKVDDQQSRVKILLRMSESEAYRQNLQIHCQILNRCSKYDYETTWKEIRKAGNTTVHRSTSGYINWKGGSVSSTFLWRGKLGAGKSVLLANVVDDLNIHVSGSQTPVAYFFCRHDISESLKARTVIGSLARQLLRSLPLLTTQNTVDVTMPDLNCDLILAALRKTLPSSFRAYFVLDGLDECDENERLTILKHVFALQQMFSLFACLSFRVDASSAQGWLATLVGNPHIGTIPDENPDITSFISSELEDKIKSGRLKVGDPAIVLEIEDALLRGSQGMFLWVFLQIESLCASKTDDALRKALADLPKDLPETFARIIQRSGEAGKDYQMRVFKLVVAACRPLTVEELQEALSVIPGNTTWDPAHSLTDVYSALACCGGLISINEEALTVKLIHHSVKQYLLGESGLSHTGLFTMDCANRAMGEIIITYLNYGVFDTSLSRVVIPEIKPEESPSKIVKSVDTISSVQALALRYLHSRRQSGYNMGKTLVDAATRDQPSHKTQFHFHSYATSHWLNHVTFVPVNEQAMSDLVVKVIRSHPSSDYIVQREYGDQHLLSWVSEHGHESIARTLLQMGADVEVRDQFDMTPLCLAARGGHSNIVNLLINKGADLESKSSIGLTPLFLAVRNKNHAIASLLLSHGANPCVSSTHGEVARLIQNAVDDSPTHKPLREFLKAKFGLGGDGKHGNRASALLLAIAAGDEAMVSLLLDHWVRAGAQLSLENLDALECAVIGGHAEIVKIFSARGWRLLYDERLLLTAIKNHDIAMVKTLLEHIPAARELGLNGGLQLAVREYQSDIVQLLLEKGADPNACGEASLPLLQAVVNKDSKIVQMLFDGGARVNLWGPGVSTMFSWAVEGGNLNIIESLASSKEFDPKQLDTTDHTGTTPLVGAIIRREFLVAKKLLELGASPEIEDRSHRTALGHAASMGFTSAMELLLDHGADPMGGSTHLPLPLAIQEGQLQSVKILVKYGAQMEPNSSKGMETLTASQFAQHLNQEGIAGYLRKKGL